MLIGNGENNCNRETAAAEFYEHCNNGYTHENQREYSMVAIVSCIFASTFTRRISDILVVVHMAVVQNGKSKMTSLM